MPSFYSEIKKLIGCIFILILISITTYFNSLKGSFQFDDLPLIQSQWVESIEAFNLHVQFSSFENRPVVLWTYALNNSLGKNQVFGFHLLNLAFHIGVSILIFFIISQTQYLKFGRGPLINKNNRTEKVDWSESSKISRSLSYQASRWSFPLIVALIFSLHPLNTDSVSYISSRSSLLATFFYLMSLFLFTRLFKRKNNIPEFEVHWGLIAIIIISVYLCIASKLIGATLPVLIAIWYLGFIFFTRHIKILKTFLNARWIASLIIFSAALFTTAYFIADSWLYKAKDQGLELYGRMPYFFIQIKVIIFYYLKLFLFPFNLNVDSGLPFSSFASDPLIFLSAIILVGILYSTLRSQNIWLAIGFIWFCITIAPTSSIIPLNDLAVEHRTYLPMTLGLCMVIGWIAFSNLRRCLILVIVLPLFALGTITRNNDWVSEVSLWQDSVKKNPHSTRAHNNLGKAYFDKGKLDLATHHLEKSVANISGFIGRQYNIKSAESYLKRRKETVGQEEKNKAFLFRPMGLLTDLVEPHYNLASVYMDQGDLENAETEYLKALALRPNHFSSQIGLSSVYNQKGLFSQAVKILESAIKNNISNRPPSLALARLNLGELYSKTGKLEKAIGQWQETLKINPSLLPAHFNLGTAYMIKGKLILSAKAFEQALKFNHRYEPALFNLAKVYQKQEKWNDSTQKFEKFLKIIGPRSNAYAQIGFNFSRQKDWKNAQKAFEKSISLQPNNIDTNISLAKTLSNLGKPNEAKHYLIVASSKNPNPDQLEEIKKAMKSLD